LLPVQQQNAVTTATKTRFDLIIEGPPPSLCCTSRRHRHERLVDPLSRQGGVVEQDAAPGSDDLTRVQPLFTIADRQRHIDRGQADRSELANRVGACTGHNQVSHGVGQVHPIGIGGNNIRRTSSRRSRRELLALAADVQHLYAVRAQPVHL